MKYSITLALFLTFMSQVANSQVINTIEVDFLNPKFPRKDIKNGSYVNVKINNINRNLYTVEGAKSEVNNNATPPTIFSAIKLPGFLTLSLASQKNISLPAQTIGKDNFIPKLDSIGNVNIEPSKAILTTLNEIERRARKLAQASDFNDELVYLSQTCGKEFNTFILPNTYTQTRDYLVIAKSINDKDLYQNLSDSLKLFTEGTLTLIDYLHILSNTYKQESKNIELSFHNDIAETLLCIADLNLTRAKRQICINKLPLDSAAYLEFKTKAKEDIADLDSCITLAGKTETEIKSFKKDGKLQILLNNYSSINESNFSYTSETTKLKTDELIYIIKAKSEKAVTCEVARERSIEVPITNISGFKVDFSAGAFINGGNNDFLQRDYFYKSVDSNTVSIEAYDRGNRVLLSIGALMHLYWRNKNKINYGFALGLSTTTGFDALNFHGGGSLIFGRKDRIVISAGVTMRDTKVLADGRSIGVNYSKNDLPEEVPVVNKFPQFGWFFAVTYNWSRLVSKKAE